MNTRPPEATAAQIAEWWDEAQDVHADNPGLAPIQLARRAAAWGWEARGAEDSSVVEAPPADPIRAALERLLERLDETREPGNPAIPAWIDSYAAARAVLASAPSDEPAVPEGREPAAVDGEPSDEELLRTYGAAKRDYGYEGDLNDWLTKVERAATVAGLRAVLARWGRPAPLPAEGEVGELVAWLTEQAVRAADCKQPMAAGMLTWAAEVAGEYADLLEQRQAAPVPVAVSERLPEAGEKTGDNEVWIEDPGQEYPLADCGDYDWDPHKWVLRPISGVDAKNGRRWIPAPALPLPSGEATNG